MPLIPVLTSFTKQYNNCELHVLQSPPFIEVYLACFFILLTWNGHYRKKTRRKRRPKLKMFRDVCWAGLDCPGPTW